jgi:hypothetical protein
VQQALKPDSSVRAAFAPRLKKARRASSTRSNFPARLDFRSVISPAQVQFARHVQLHANTQSITSDCCASMHSDAQT